MFNNLSEIKNLKVYPFDVFHGQWTENDVDWMLRKLPEPTGSFLGLEYSSNWRTEIFTKAMETGRATVEFTDPSLKIVYKLVLEYEGDGKFKFMNIPKCFRNYKDRTSFDLDERHFKIHRQNSLIDYLGVNLNSATSGAPYMLPAVGTCWGTTLKATTQAIKKLYEISEENIIIALKQLCVTGYVVHAGLCLSLANYGKAVVEVSRLNSEYHRPRMFVIDNNVLEEIIAAPMPKVKKKSNKTSKPNPPAEPSLFELLGKLGGSPLLKFDSFK